MLAWCETTRVLSVSLCLFALKPLSFLHMFFDTSIPPFPTSFFHLSLTSLHYFLCFSPVLALVTGRGGALTLSANWRLVMWYTNQASIQFCAKMLTYSRNYDVHSWRSQKRGHRRASGWDVAISHDGPKNSGHCLFLLKGTNQVWLIDKWLLSDFIHSFIVNIIWNLRDWINLNL